MKITADEIFAGIMILIIIGGVFGAGIFQTQAVGTCYDSDGINLEEKGYCEKDGYQAWDYCYSSTEVIEQRCNAYGTCEGNLYTCPGSCIDGACVEPSVCIDSDAGKDYYTKGKVVYNGQTTYDYCEGDHLFEQYCSNNIGREYEVRCMDGCSNGKCLYATTTSSAVTSTIPETTTTTEITTIITQDAEGEVSIMYLGIFLTLGGALLFITKGV